MVLHLTLEMRGSLRPTGGTSSRLSVGRSVASASAPNVSMIRFTHSSWTAVNGTSPDDTAATKLIVSAATFTVN